MQMKALLTWYTHPIWRRTYKWSYLGHLPTETIGTWYSDSSKANTSMASL